MNGEERNRKQDHSDRRFLSLLLTVCLSLSSIAAVVLGAGEGGWSPLSPSVVQAASETYGMPIPLVSYQTEARKQLDMINAFRTGDDAWYWVQETDSSGNVTESKVRYAGLTELTYDYSLEKVAMQRAAEIAVYFAHYRVDGKDYGATYSDLNYSFTSAVENIAFGYQTAEEAFAAWQESDQGYAGQGHRRNMLNETFTSCAFGCVSYQGVYYWTQEFAVPKEEGIEATDPVDGEMTGYVNFPSDTIDSISIEDLLMEEGTTKNLSEMDVTLTYHTLDSSGNAVTNSNGDIIKDSRILDVSPNFRSTKTSVASIANGVLTADGAGTSTLRADFPVGSKVFVPESTVKVIKTVITLDHATLSVTPNVITEIHGAIGPAESAYTTLRWSSSNPEVASLYFDAEGLSNYIDAKQPGWADITAQTLDGTRTAVCKVHVFYPVTDISVSPKKKQLESGETLQLTSLLTPEDATDLTVNWTSSDERVATVTTSGLVSAVSSGTVEIKAEAQNDGDEEKPFAVTTITVVQSDSPVDPEEVVKSVAMYRLYNKHTGEHFFTSRVAERDFLVTKGWVYENVGWNAPETSATPVYRVYNPNSGEHHYTVSIFERDNLVSLGWEDEDIGWYSDDDETTPLYRLYNPNATGIFEAGGHHYTTNKEERNNLIKMGWQNEYIGWYGLE